MSIVKEIDIRQPNAELVSDLEYLLDQARKGEMVGMLAVTYWQGERAVHGITVDERSDRYKMLGVAQVAINHFADEIAAHYGDTPFAVRGE